MNRATRKLLENSLKGKMFGTVVDLGCGEGFYGPLLKKHCTFLVGVDHNLGRLSVAKEFSGYDQVHPMDVRRYTPPPETEAIIMLEIIEHLSKPDGHALLQNLRHIPFMVVSTPVEFHSWTFRNGHLSLWTEQDLQQYGFKTQMFKYAFPASIFSFDQGIFAVREL